MLVCVRLCHVAGTKWGVKRHMNMDHLNEMVLQENDSIIGINTLEFYEISQQQKTYDFIKVKYKKRASIEGENAELRRFHGLDRAEKLWPGFNV